MRRNAEHRIGSSVLKAAAGALILAALAPLAALGDEAVFEVVLSGPEASGDPDGRGQATVTLRPQTNEVEVRLSYSNIAEPTAMHLRKGATGTAGNVEVPLVVERAGRGSVVGRRKSAAPGIVERIARSPGEYYLVVINAEHPVGALRGPLED